MKASEARAISEKALSPEGEKVKGLVEHGLLCIKEAAFLGRRTMHDPHQSDRVTALYVDAYREALRRLGYKVVCVTDESQGNRSWWEISW
jgi:hypothetical protein